MTTARFAIATRVVWDVLHSIKYLPGYVLRDNLDIKVCVLLLLLLLLLFLMVPSLPVIVSTARRWYDQR
jgi:hypothetical protein